jgi:oxygen-independent coproporphyrinogen-3 oxidase
MSETAPHSDSHSALHSNSPGDFPPGANPEATSAATLIPKTAPYDALYLHIPFCAQRCSYCDFTTEAVAPDDPRLDTYVEGLIRDIRVAAHEGLLARVRTVYIGGGTPSFLGARRLVNLVYTLSLFLPPGSVEECTLEANPESLTPALVRDLYSLGVDRFSLGVQSFNDAELAALGRVHDSRTARRAVEAALERASRVSIDLMCGIPLQTAASWRASLDAALQSGVSHISVYPLTVEENTAFVRAIEGGRQSAPDEDEQANMMELAQDVLNAAGMRRYEVASYAQPGFECRHNSAYWTGLSYLGLGVGAAGMRNLADGSRERTLDGKVIERLTPARAVIEDLMLGMRLSRGVDEALLRCAASHMPAITGVFDELASLGLTSFDGGRHRPTRQGWLLGNELYTRIWHCAPPD